VSVFVFEARKVREEESEEVRVVPLDISARLRRKTMKNSVRSGQDTSASM